MVFSFVSHGVNNTGGHHPLVLACSHHHWCLERVANTPKQEFQTTVLDAPEGGDLLPKAGTTGGGSGSALLRRGGGFGEKSTYPHAAYHQENGSSSSISRKYVRK